MRRPPTIAFQLVRADDLLVPDSQPGEPRSTAVRTLKLCAAPTRRQTTLLGAIARSVADLERTGRFSRTIRVPARRGAFA